MAMRMHKHLNWLGVLEFKIAPILAVAVWLGCWFGLGMRWWLAPLLALPVVPVILFCTYHFTTRYVKRVAARMLALWPPDVPAHMEAVAAVITCKAQLKEDLLLDFCGLTDQDTQPGVMLVAQMAASVRSGRSVRQAINEVAEMTREVNDFLASEFLEDCDDILQNRKAEPVASISSAAFMYQMKVLLEKTPPGGEGPFTPTTVLRLRPLYQHLAREAMSGRIG